MSRAARCGLLLAVAGTLLPISAFAQNAEPYVPSYARPSYASPEVVLRGRIMALGNTPDVQVSEGDGYTSDVVIAPGLTVMPYRLQVGMPIVIHAVRNASGSLATRIEIADAQPEAAPPPPPPAAGPQKAPRLAARKPQRASHHALPAVSFAYPAHARHEVVVRGRIASFDGRYRLTLREEDGRYDDVRLKHGTVINPRGRRLRPGLPVVMRALGGREALLALRIDDLSHAVALRRWNAIAQRYRHAQYVQARTAAQRLANRLERMYGKRIVAVVPPPHAVHRPRNSPAADPQEIQPTWYGWGKL